MVGFIIRRLLWTIPVLLLVILMTFLMMRHIQGNPFRHSERAVSPEVQANLERKFNLDKPWYVQYAALREGRGDVRPRAVARPAQPERERHREGALPEVARARIPGDGVRDRLRDTAGGDRGVTPEHGLRLHGDVLLERRVRGPELPDRDAPHLLLRAQVGRHHRHTDERVDDLAVEDPARHRAGPRPDGLLRAARARDDAGDAPAGLRAHGEGEGPAARAGSCSCTSSRTR